MNIRTSLKLTFFSLICTLICYIALAITNIEIIALVAEGFFVVSYFAFVTWICGIFSKNGRYYKNWMWCFVPFSVALYSGTRSFAFTGLQDINVIEEWGLNDVIFVVSSLITLVAVIAFIWRLFFGKAPQKEEMEEVSGWICECGTENTGMFCAECGKPAPAPQVTVESENA